MDTGHRAELIAMGALNGVMSLARILALRGLLKPDEVDWIGSAFTSVIQSLHEKQSNETVAQELLRLASEIEQQSASPLATTREIALATWQEPPGENPREDR